MKLIRNTNPEAIYLFCHSFPLLIPFSPFLTVYFSHSMKSLYQYLLSMYYGPEKHLQRIFMILLFHRKKKIINLLIFVKTLSSYLQNSKWQPFNPSTGITSSFLVFMLCNRFTIRFLFEILFCSITFGSLTICAKLFLSNPVKFTDGDGMREGGCLNDFTYLLSIIGKYDLSPWILNPCQFPMSWITSEERAKYEFFNL